MNISDFQYEQDKKMLEQLAEDGYVIEVYHHSYRIMYKDTHVFSAGSLGGRRKNWRHMEADLRDNLHSAVIGAQRHKRQLSQSDQ